MHINYILIIVAFLLTGCASKSASYYYTQKQLQHGDLRFHHTLRINEYLNAFEQDWLVVPANQEIVVRKDSLTQKDTPVGEHVFKQIAVKTRRLSREESRKPIAICFVIDISGSMSGENIDDTRVALKNAVRELRNGDRISIVLFNHESYVLTSNVLISHESIISLLTNIDKIQAIGGTDIELGLVTGYEEMAKFPKTVNQRLLLLTDGRSNVQARSPQEIANQASIDYSENVRISTIGLGHGVDETVLRDIAEKGGGHYYFANNGKTLTKFLREDLHTTIVPVAKDVHLAINLGSTYELINIYGPQPEKDSSSNNLKVNLGELNANDWRILILELKRVSSQAKGIQVSGDYFSIAQQKSSDIVQSVQPAQAQSNINKYVLRNSIIFANV
ncbi:MAG: VWA domain-containing protein [Gammaproteobacteria bacterium]|nr:VWA domain-containing protein [Gammaproteobacteria bacterium]